MQTIQLDQLQPGQEFRITLSCFAPIETDTIKFIADVDGKVIFSAPDTPLMKDNRDNLSRHLRRAGLVMLRE